MIGSRVSGTIWSVQWCYLVPAAKGGEKPAPVCGRTIVITSDPTGADLLPVAELVVLGAKATPANAFTLTEMSRIANVDGLAQLQTSEARWSAVAAKEEEGAWVEIRAPLQAVYDRCAARIAAVRDWGIVASIRVPEAGGFQEVPIPLVRGEYIVIGAAPDVQTLEGCS